MDDGLEDYLANMHTLDIFKQPPTFSLSNNVPVDLIFDKQLSQPQNFSLPKPLITYLATASARIYQKMISTCKYFYSTKSILVIQDLNRNDGCFTFTKPEWTFQVFGKHRYSLGPNFDFNQISPEIWIEKSMDVRDLMNPKILCTAVLPKIYQCNVTHLNIRDQEIFFEEFLLLSTDVVDICIGSMAKIKNPDESIVLIEKLVANLPKLEKLRFEFSRDIPAFTSESLKNLLELENFKKLRDIMFFYIYDIFDILMFSEYMMDNRNVKFHLYYCLNGDEEDYIAKIETVIEKLATVEFTTRPIIL